MEDDTIVSLLIDEAASAGQDLHALDQQLFNIRLANSAGRREAASVLLQKMYGWRGYEVDPNAPHEPNRITLAAESQGEIVGTMSLCLDDPAIGLPADENFGDILSGWRAEGRRLCEPARLAIDRNVNMRVFAALIHISYVYAHNLHGCTDYVIEVNPRHVMFYKRMLGFHEAAPRRHCSRVDARYIARMLHPVLGQLSPEEALLTVTSHPSFIGDWGGPQQPLRANGRPRS